MPRPPLTLRNACVALGMLHALAMVLFVTGPELAPLMVYLVDYPVAAPLLWLGLGEMLALWSSLVICSVLYPWLIFHIVRLLFGRLRR